MNKMKTGKLIKDARIKKGYTQQELGDIVGVSNKAVSRWEQGESFPDVSLLDTISYTLDLSIDEIVLGESRDKDSNDVAIEIAQIARMEKNRKNRIIINPVIIIAIFVFLAMLGIGTIINGLNGWSVQVFYYSCLISVFAVALAMKNNILKFGMKDSVNKVIIIISAVSVIYSILLVLGSLGLYLRGINILGMDDVQIGPFINWQLLFVFLINAIAILVLVWKAVVKNNNIGMGVYSSILGVFLSLAYSDLLHRLSSPEDFLKVFILDSFVIIAIVLVGIVVTLNIIPLESHQFPS